ncbi:MAG: DUF3160 domain-containing protein [Candidatus Hodarchaeales archaeon]|jgi:hypothetical protein
MKKSFSTIVLIIILFLPLVRSFEVPTETQSEMTNPLSSLGYFDLMDNAFNLTSDELTMLEKNRFIVLNRLGTDDLLNAYRYYWDEDLPIIITTDALLQTWHIVFDKTLEQLEEEIFFPLLRNFSLALKNTFLQQISVGNDDIAVQDALVYLTVGAKIADPTVDVPDIVSATTNQILKSIYDEITIFDAILEFQSLETKRFIDDFSMYRPRGHYTLSDNLQTYFRLFKWFSRIPFFFDDYPGEIYLNRSPEELVRSASYLIYVMKNTHVKLDDLGIDANGFEVWKGFKRFFDLLVGETYMVTPIILDEIVTSVRASPSWHPDEITNEDVIAIQNHTLTDDSIPAPKDPFIIDAIVPIELWPEKLRETVSSCKSLLLFGERLTLDTYSGNHLVYPFVAPQGDWWFDNIPDGIKNFPNGLEFATTIFKSERAHKFLSTIDHTQYQGQLNSTIQEMDNWTLSDKQALSWKWMETLSHLTQTQPEFNESTIPVVPEFMKTEAWLDEKLTTVLGSWAQLKHDTILYSKQGMTVGVCSTPEGYVEPYPLFFNALGNLIQTFKNSVVQLESLGLNNPFYLSGYVGSNESMDHVSYDLNEFLNNFTEVVQILENIAHHELQGEELTDEEKNFLKDTYSVQRVGNCMPTWMMFGWLSKILSFFNGEYVVTSEEYFDPVPTTRTSLIADIHTDVNSESALEVATGYMEPLIAVVPGWNGTDILAVGPVFSYYEFIIPMGDRMTDEDWRGILAASHNVDRSQNYNFSVFQRGIWAQSYMTSTEMTSSIVYSDNGTLRYGEGSGYYYEQFEAPIWFLIGNTSIIDSYLAEIYVSPTAYSFSYPKNNLDPPSTSRQATEFPLVSLLPFIVLLVNVFRKKRKKERIW